MLGGPVALIVTFHETALVIATLVAAIAALVSLAFSRGAAGSTKALVALGMFAATLVLGYEVLTRTVGVDGVTIETVRTAG